jgi:hypothetical protein
VAETTRDHHVRGAAVLTASRRTPHFPRDYQYVLFLRKSKRMAYRYERGQLLSMEFSIRKHDPHR